MMTAYDNTPYLYTYNGTVIGEKENDSTYIQIHLFLGWFGDLVIDFSISRAKGPYMHNLPYAYAYAPLT